MYGPYCIGHTAWLIKCRTLKTFEERGYFLTKFLLMKDCQQLINLSTIVSQQKIKLNGFNSFIL